MRIVLLSVVLLLVGQQGLSFVHPSTPLGAPWSISPTQEDKVCSLSSPTGSGIHLFDGPRSTVALRAAVSNLPNELSNMIGALDVSKVGLEHLQKAIPLLDGRITAELDRIGRGLQSQLERIPAIQPILERMKLLFKPLLSTSPALIAVFGALAALVVFHLVESSRNDVEQRQPYPSLEYDAVSAQAYFNSPTQRMKVLYRGLEIVLQILLFGISLLKDKLSNKLEENEYSRGQELATVLTKLGPGFIKIGQVLSSRTDILPHGYTHGLSSLQDQVPPFPTEDAQEILEEEWGEPLESVIVGSLTEQPVAAASLGQVYKARLGSTGHKVAIKVQRPDVLEQIAMDMHLLRVLAPLIKDTFGLNTDLVATVDTWATGFVKELDYRQEARNADSFSKKIVRTPLRDVVFAPRVVKSVSTSRVLVTEWVDGERLDQISSEDVTLTTTVAMNAFLTMLLEFGELHSDPHCGNLLRTSDGRLCILDWGMVTELETGLQSKLVEHIVHLTSSDYEELPNDLLRLGFIDPGRETDIKESGVAQILADIYKKWTKGGGATAVHAKDVIERLQATSQNGNLFRIPPYFAYIFKTLSILEGIGLSNDPKYSVVKDCLPYVSQRLLADKETMGPALSAFIFGANKTDVDRLLNYDRVEQLVDGLGKYSTVSSNSRSQRESVSRAEAVKQATDRIIDLVVTEEDTPIQAIVLEQLAKFVASSSRSVLTKLGKRSGSLPSGRSILGATVDPMGLLHRSSLVHMNELDEKTVETARSLISLVKKQTNATDGVLEVLSALSPREAVEIVATVAGSVWERRKGVIPTARRFARQMLELSMQRLEQGPGEPDRLDKQKLSRTYPWSLKAASDPTSGSDESDRLQRARRRLRNLLGEDEMELEGQTEALSELSASSRSPPALPEAA